MRSLIIGASGHLGAHLARVLLAAGDEVRALVRPTSDLRGLAGLPVELVPGDVLDAGSLARAMTGRDGVYHLAAPTSLEPGLTVTIRDGTRNALEQARRAGVRRLVYTSSIVTVGYSPGPAVVLDESARERTPASEYHAAKWDAEEEVLASGLEVVVVNPATVIGPLDYRVTPSNRPIQQCLDRGLPFAFDSGLTVVHAEDVARGHLLAMRRGRPGQRYILGGDRVTVPDYFRVLCRLCGRPAPRLTLPRWAMLALGAGFSAGQALGVRRVPFNYAQAAHLVGRYGWYSSEKAAGELGYRWRPAEEAAAGYVRWVRAGRRAA